MYILDLIKYLNNFLNLREYNNSMNMDSFKRRNSQIKPVKIIK